MDIELGKKKKKYIIEYSDSEYNTTYSYTGINRYTW